MNRNCLTVSNNFCVTAHLLPFHRARFVLRCARMNKTVLLMTALATAPLYAAAPDYVQMAQPAAVATKTLSPAECASACAALAQLPADTEVFLTVGNVGKMLGEVLPPELTRDPQAAMLLNVDSIAIGSGADALAEYAKWAPVLGAVQGAGITEDLAQLWAEPSSSEIPVQVSENIAQEQKTAAIQMLKAGELPPTHIVVSFKGQDAASIPVMLRGMALMSLMSEAAGPGIIPVTEKGAALGDGDMPAGLMLDMDALLTDEEAPEEAQPVLDALKGKKLYLLAAVKDSSLVLTICTDPAKIQLPENAESSLAATDKVKPFEARMGEGFIAAGYASAAWSNAETASRYATAKTIAKLLTDVFTAFKGQDASAADTYTAAIEGVEKLLTMGHDAMKPEVGASTMLVWQDKDVHVELEGDNSGCSFSTATLNLNSLADKEDTILFTAGTQCEGSCDFDCAAFGDSVSAVANGVLATLTGETRLQAEAALSQLSSFKPLAEEMLHSMGTMHGALGNARTLVVAAAPAADERKLAEFPIVTVQAPITNRAQFEQGWAEYRTAANKLAPYMGVAVEADGKDIFADLPVETTEENGTTYHVIGGNDHGNIVPTAAISDKSLMLCTLADKAQELVALSGTESTTFSGVAMTLRFAPLAKSLRGMAKLFPTPEYDDTDWEDDEEETEESTEPTEVTMGDNRDMIEAAEMLEAIDSKVERVDATVSSHGDRSRVNIIIRRR